MRKFAVTGVVLALGLLIAACGGSDSSSTGSSVGEAPASQGGELTKAAFIEKADAICKENDEKDESEELQKEVRELTPEEENSPKGEIKIAEALHAEVAEAEANLVPFEELEPPTGDQAVISNLVEVGKHAFDLIDEAATNIEEGEAVESEKQINEAEQEAAKAKGLEEGYGFKVCGQGSE